MDIQQILKEMDQKNTRYEMNKGSVKGVLDYNPDLDLESGTQELEEKRQPKNCAKGDICGWICITPLIVGAFTLFGYTVYHMVISAMERSEDYQS